MNAASKRLFWAWLPALIWLAAIAFESTDAMSSENTGRFLYPVFHFLLGLRPERFQVWHHYIRKTSHFVGYFTLSLLLFRALRASAQHVLLKRWALRWGTAAFFLTALVASLDEWHQTFIPSRTGTIRDVFLDSAAALTAQVLIFWFFSFRRGETRNATLNT